MDNWFSVSAKANPVTTGFRWATMTVPSSCRQCVFPSDAEGMYHGTDARLPDGYGANSR